MAPRWSIFKVAFMVHFGRLLEPTWGPFGGTWGHFGRLWGYLGPKCRRLGLLGGQSVADLGLLGANLGYLGRCWS